MSFEGIDALQVGEELTPHARWGLLPILSWDSETFRKGEQDQAGRSRGALLVLREPISTTKRFRCQPKCTRVGSTTRGLSRDQLPA